LFDVVEVAIRVASNIEKRFLDNMNMGEQNRHRTLQYLLKELLV